MTHLLQTQASEFIVTQLGSKDGEVTDPVTSFLTHSVNNNYYIQPTVTFYMVLQSMSC